MSNDGFEVPVHRSLTEVILLGGVPRTPAILLWTLAGALAFGLQQLWVLPVAIGLHFGLVSMTKQDPFFFDVFIQAIKSPKRLYP
jgi:type IV secretion system protein VirB3